MMDRLGPSIFWIPVLIGGTEGPVPVRTWVVFMGGIPTVFLSTIIVPPVSFQFTTVGYLRTPAALRVAPVRISLWRTERTACKFLTLVATPYAVVWLTGGMMPWMIAGISLFINNLCGEFTLVVSVSVIFSVSVTSVSSYQWIAFWIAFGNIFL